VLIEPIARMSGTHRIGRALGFGPAESRALRFLKRFRLTKSPIGNPVRTQILQGVGAAQLRHPLSDQARWLAQSSLQENPDKRSLLASKNMFRGAKTRNLVLCRS
jgi:hypothetical protein